MTGPHFDHLRTGTPFSQWQALRSALPEGALVGGHDHLLVLAAHPDDETLGAGGLLADAARLGAQVTVVIATDGEGSHPHSPTHTAADLVALRQSEAAAAVAVLAPHARLVQLHLPDGGLVHDAVASALEPLIAEATVVAAPWRADGHPDHDVCGAVAAQLCSGLGARLLEYPVWGWHWGTPGGSGPLVGDGWVRRAVGSAGRAARTAALEEYRSQHSPLSDAAGDEAVLQPAFLEHFSVDHEVFAEAEPVDLPARYFERLYAAGDDPWAVDSGFYEQRKRQLLLASLPRARFGTAFEPGCGQGVTTALLAKRCDHVLAADASATAVVAARERLGEFGNVDVHVLAVPDEWPDGRFDLIVVSELGYYFADPAGLARRVRAALTDDGVLVACHWRHPAPGYPSSAAEVHEALGAGLQEVVHHVEPDFLLDVWSVRPLSVAASTGVL